MNTAARALAQTGLGAKNVWTMLFFPQQLTVTLLAALVFFSSLGVVYMKDFNRRLYRDLQQQQTQHQHLQTEWGQLLLEQSTWSQQIRVEKVAADQLQMITPQQQNIIMVAE